MILTAKQTKAYDYLSDNTTKEIGYGGGAGGGKSALGCLWQIERRLRYPETRGLIGRAKLKTLKETTLNTFFQVAKMQGLISGVHFTLNNQSNTIKFYNGSEILLKDLFYYPSDPEFDELGSLEITDAFIDESAQITEKAYTILKSRIRYKLTDYDLVPKILWTSNPSKNWNYDRFYLPWRNGILPKDRAFVQSLAKDNPHLSKHYIESLEDMPLAQKERLLLGNWEYDDDPTKLIDYDSIVSLYSNEYVEAGKRYITADIARYGSDLLVIMVWSGFVVVKIITLQKSSISESVNIMRSLAVQYRVPLHNIIADEDGVGGGVIDVLGCRGFVNGSKAIGNPDKYLNLKSECYFALAEKVNKNEIYIMDETGMESVKQELEYVKSHNADKDGKLRIIPKDKVKELIGRSPDYSDALMMRMWFDIRESKSGGGVSYQK